ncbi:MAG TPA: protein-glutamate O-methyltransferase CheR [Gammaproteobacteria bacterium]|nr:protein-glutamate O-methyltransferase CheR [Gammaproteobacteria bacterium]
MKTNTAHDLLEAELLLEAIYRVHGYDFRSYARASILRRIQDQVQRSKIQHISDLISKVIYDEDFFHDMLENLPIKVTEMFRDPFFYKALRSKVIPHLQSYPFIKIWSAGCATGEEAYSLSILLKEEELLHKAHIYATDINLRALKTAKEATYPVETMVKNRINYQKFEGKSDLENYYFKDYHHVRIAEYLRNKIIFSEHSLVTDGIFGEMNVIVCRNVMIYFDHTLQNKVFTLLCNSLCYQGFLCLGDKETLNFSAIAPYFKEIDPYAKIYQKKVSGYIT